MPDKQWEYCYVPRCPLLKVLDLSDDNDGVVDKDRKFTRATLKSGPLPESFTICSAFMVEAWTTGFEKAYMFALLDYKGGIHHFLFILDILSAVKKFSAIFTHF